MRSNLLEVFTSLAVLTIVSYNCWMRDMHYVSHACLELGGHVSLITFNNGAEWQRLEVPNACVSLVLLTTKIRIWPPPCHHHTHTHSHSLAVLFTCISAIASLWLRCTTCQQQLLLSVLRQPRELSLLMVRSQIMMYQIALLYSMRALMLTRNNFQMGRSSLSRDFI